MMDATLPDGVRDAVDVIGERLLGGAVTAVSVVGQRPDYYVLRLEAGKERFIVKLAGSASNEPSFEMGAAPQRLVANNTSVPVAEILAADDSCSIVPYRFNVQTAIRGEPWAIRSQKLDAEQLREARRGLGDVIAELHSLPVPGYGRFDGAGLVASPKTLFPALLEHANGVIRHRHLLDSFAAVLNRHETEFSDRPQSGVTHEDLHGYNILFDLGNATKVSAILDFDKAWAGPVESDLARLEVWRGMTSAAFHDAYRSIVPMADGYHVRRPIYQLLWCYEYAVDSADHIALTNSLHDQLGIRAIESFSA